MTGYSCTAEDANETPNVPSLTAVNGVAASSSLAGAVTMPKIKAVA